MQLSNPSDSTTLRKVAPSTQNNTIIIEAETALLTVETDKPMVAAYKAALTAKYGNITSMAYNEEYGRMHNLLQDLATLGIKKHAPRRSGKESKALYGCTARTVYSRLSIIRGRHTSGTGCQ